MPAFSWLDPFAGLRFDLVYAKFSGAIDFMLCLVLFSGVCHLVFGRRFPGRSGHLLRVVMTLILSISFLVFEMKSGFNLAKLGPVALLVLLFLFAILVARVMLRWGAHSLPGLFITYVLWFLLLRFFVPEIPAWMVAKAPWLSSALSWLALGGLALFCVWLVLTSDDSAASDPQKRPSPSRREIPRVRRRLEGPEPRSRGREGPRSVDDLGSGVQELEQESSTFEKRLKWVTRALQKKDLTYRELERCQQEMRFLLAEKGQVSTTLARLKELNTCLARLDLKDEAILENAARQYKDLPASVRAGIRKEIGQRRNKLEVEKRISEFEDRAVAANRELEYLITQAMGTLAAGDRKTAAEWLLAAPQREEQVRQISREIERFIAVLKKIASDSVASV